MKARYSARCTFGAQAGCQHGSACGRLVGRGHLMCDDHESAVTVPMAIDYPSLARYVMTSMAYIVVGLVRGYV